MATQQHANIYITNDTDGDASILLYHNNSSNGTQSASWSVGPGATVGPLEVYFETGVGSWGIQDYWSVLLNVNGGATPGYYVSSGTLPDPYWKECQLQHEDASQNITLSVSSTTFDVALKSGGCTGGMTKLAPYAPITNVFVVMLENHSFDNMFAMSEISGITVANTSDYNVYNGQNYDVQSSAGVSMPTDPGHEFPDVVEQLAGDGAIFQSGQPYPTINNAGFAANYATTTTEGPPPPAQDIGDIMACFSTQSQLPVAYQLATQFAICDHWYSSIPGPTWPNRFFVHGASSSGLDHSPTSTQILEWESGVPGGFAYPNGSIYQALSDAGIPYRFYNDSNTTAGLSYGQSIFSDDPQNGNPSGAVPQVSSLQGVTIADINSLAHFASDLQGPYPYTYTFIEPHYGDVIGNTYAGGSSQHPMDDVAGGENLIQFVYESIRNSPYWNTSLLVIVYDEHGGFYDSVAPTGATPPGDNPNYGYNEYGFAFDQYGVRVPAIIVSPLIPPGTVSTSVYDHSSVLATLENLYGLAALTGRDGAANNLTSLLTQQQLRTDCPTKLAAHLQRRKPSRPLSPEEQAIIDQQPIPERGNLPGVLSILLKAEIELSSRNPAVVASLIAKVKALKTRGEARLYIDSVMLRVKAVRDARAAARP